MSLWPNQVRFVDSALAAVRGRQRHRLLLSSPTGTGKSVAMCHLIERLAQLGFYVVLYTNRRWLIEQLIETLTDHGIRFGVRAAGYEDEDTFFPVQISSLLTEVQRVLKRSQWEVHGKGRPCVAIVDEAHLNNGEKARAIYAKHRAEGHFIVGVTATPIDLGDSYDELIVCGTLAEGRECGALMWAHQYAPDEPDWRAFRAAKKKGRVSPNAPEADAGDAYGASEKQARSVMGHMTPDGPSASLYKLQGRLWDNYQLINPDRRPGICFGPGVEEGIYIAEQFTKRGVRSCHIDGDHIWLDGELHRSSPELRKEVLAESKAGRLPMIVNRFVMREGIDAPWLGHLILATVVGELKTYLQAGGRILRYHSSLEKVTVQDHGGNCYRFGSLNADREWFLDATDAGLVGARIHRIRQGKEQPPFRCPKCNMVWGKGSACSPTHGGCGYVIQPKEKRSRMVVTTEGELRLTQSQLFAPRRTYSRPGGEKLWERMVFRAMSKKWDATWNQAFAYFAYENNYSWPDFSWPFMPLDEYDHTRRVTDTPLDRIRFDPFDPSQRAKVEGFLRTRRPELFDGPTESTPAPEPAADPFA